MSVSHTPVEAGASDAVTILYTNWRGETAVRRIIVPTIIGTDWMSMALRFKSNEWHPEPQWLLAAYDIGKEAGRDFALSGIKAWGQEAVNAALAPSAGPVPDEVRRLALNLLMTEAFDYGVRFADPELGVGEDHESARKTAIDRALTNFAGHARTLLATPSGRPDTPPAGGGAMPDGYWLAPLEATDAMMDAAGTCLTDGLDRSLAGGEGSSLGDIWRAYREAAPAAPVSATTAPHGYRLVPESALAWLFGEGPDTEGLSFGDAPRSHGAFWWRSQFRRLIEAAAPEPTKLDGFTVIPEAALSSEDAHALIVGDAVVVPAAPEPAAGGGREIVRHLKRGTEYEVLGEAEAQVSAKNAESDRFGNWIGLYEGDKLVVYRCRETGKLWCRAPDEFRDGRFETVTDPATTAPAHGIASDEGVRARQDAALREAIRNWSARLHIPVTRMMSRTLREEFATALAATKPDSTEGKRR